MIHIYTVNFLLAIATTIGMTIIPFLITDSLGLSLFILGILEGFSELLSNVFRLTNGVLFDKIKNKRLLFISSTFLALFSKTLLFLPSAWAILFAKIFERIANGTFASPRDAYVATHAKNKGMALGLLGVSKSLGCILGPLIVSLSTLFIGDLKNNVHIFILLCCLMVLPAFLLSFSLNVKDIKEKHFSLKDLNAVLKIIFPILIITFLFFMGRFNDGLLMIYLKRNGYPEWFYLSTISIFNSIMLITSPLMGKKIDKGQLKRMLIVTILSLILFNLFFYEIKLLGWTAAILGIFAWGVQRAGAQIVFASLVFRNIDKSHYGTAIGLFYITSGIATMLASFGCGYLATHYRFESIFLVSGAFAILSLIYAAKQFNQSKAL